MTAEPQDDSMKTTEVTKALEGGAKPEEKGTTNFTVDSALLRELGERLVGKPHIALAELVKNSYDADATHVDILFEGETIEIIDNGHGMSFEEFEHFWMRVGSPHKQEQRFSENLTRPLTGSKGVGRLAVQFLAREIEIRTCRRDSNQEVRAKVDWDEAVRAGSLTEAEAHWQKVEPPTTRFARQAKYGTSIRLSRLRKTEWEKDDFEGLGKEIWWLQPPFVDPYRDKSADFTVELTTPYPEVLAIFERQMRAFMDLWHAKIEGRLIPLEDGAAEAEIALHFSDEERFIYRHRMDDCLIDKLTFEIRTYYLSGRQKYGIKVGEARDYFADHGGVYVYDSGFRLPYYGGQEHDWLELEFAHAHRLSRSKLLPDELQIHEGLNYLPTNSRILGAVRIDTANERSSSDHRDSESHDTDYLEIQVTRDRLVDNKAYEQLRDIVRAAVDFYAVEEARRAFLKKQKSAPIEAPTAKLERVEEVLELHRSEIPEPVFMQLRAGLAEATEASESEAEARASQVSLLAPLATAGMAALAYEHEVTKQLSLLESLVDRLDRIAESAASESGDLLRVRDGLKSWMLRARQTRRLFTHLLDAENRDQVIRLRAQPLVREITEQSELLLRGAEIRLDGVDEDLRLPLGTFAEWSALFQNVLVNATNAMLDSSQQIIRVESRMKGAQREIRIEDTGTGIDLSRAPKLFEPFSRELEISSGRRQLGLGGTGLGLTIVRMIAENRGCRVDFTEPSQGFATAFRLAWKEMK